MSKQMELWGIEDLAEEVGITAATAAVWRHRGKLPDPEWVISARPVWKATTVRRWIASGGARDRRMTA